MRTATENRRVAVLTMALASTVAAGCGDTPPPAQPPTPPEPAAAAPPPAEPAPAPTALPKDDGRTLWAAPTSGEPIPLAGVLDGAQLILHLKPAELLSSGEGRRLWRALGRLGERADSAIAAAGGSDADGVERLLVSLAPGEEYGSLASAVSIDPAADEGPLLSREFETLCDTSDRARHATLIVSPEFLLGSGGTLVGDSEAPLRRFLLDYCDEDWQAIALSVHLSEGRLYWELRVLGSSTTPELRRARELVERIGASPKELGGLIDDRPFTDHAAPLLLRTPAMLTTVVRYARRGVDGRQAVVNGYLPAHAAHNLALAAELLIAELSAPAGAAPAVATEELSLADRLRTPVSIRFDREPLESALTVLANSTGATIEILGRDLQLEGITRNQMLSLDLRETPAEAALVELLRRANPDPLASGPADPRQKLVYVTRDDLIVITTRAGASRRGESLPTVFQP